MEFILGKNTRSQQPCLRQRAWSLMILNVPSNPSLSSYDREDAIQKKIIEFSGKGIVYPKLYVKAQTKSEIWIIR